jgi:hypothetical protein
MYSRPYPRHAGRAHGSPELAGAKRKYPHGRCIPQANGMIGPYLCRNGGRGVSARVVSVAGRFGVLHTLYVTPKRAVVAY